MKPQSPRILKDLEELLGWAEPHLRCWENQNLYVTGGTGFFGKWLLETFKYCREKRKIRFGNIYVLSRSPESFIRNHPHLQQFDFVEGDIRDFSLPKKPIHGFIHGATAASAQLNSEAPKEMYDTIVDGTRRALVCAKESRSCRFIMISSGAVYGKKTLEDSPSKEEDYTGSIRETLGDAYAEGKREAERLAISAESGELSAVVARCYAFLGPYLPLNTHFAAGNFIADCLSGREIVIKGDGLPRRTYLYPSDLMGWLFVILAQGKKNRVYNVGSDRTVSILEVARLVQKEALGLGLPDVSIQVLKEAEKGKPIPVYAPSIKRAQTELGLQIRVDLKEAIRRTLEYHMEERK